MREAMAKREAETKALEEAGKEERQHVKEHIKAQHKPPRIRPLSESKAIEMGANFISETFLFLVAAAAVVFEPLRLRRKENNRREGIDDKLEDLEKELSEMRTMIDLPESEVIALTK